MLTLHLPTEQLEQLRRELASAGRREVGGILMGEQVLPGRFTIVEMTVQRHGGTFAWFVRQARLALRALQEFFDRTGHRYRRYNYLGEWHSHPSFEARPSNKDHESMINVARHPRTGANFVVLMIVRITESSELEASVTTYFPDGSARPGTLVVGEEARV